MNVYDQFWDNFYGSNNVKSVCRMLSSSKRSYKESSIAHAIAKGVQVPVLRASRNLYPSVNEGIRLFIGKL